MSEVEPSDRRVVYAPYVPTHDHDHDEEAVTPLQDNPIWQQDNVTLHSVGMDIGSSGTQVLFSRLHLRRIGEDLTSRYIVIERETLYRSPVALTPYRTDDLIDTDVLGRLIDNAYGEAAIGPEDIDTGVVILTGEALRRRNAQAIAGVLAERGGELVTASAGHNMEAMLAAYGSGAARNSYEHDHRILNVDIGGGTTKLALVERGKVVATAAIHVGGRLQVVEDDRIVRLEPAGRRHALEAGYDLQVGDECDSEVLEAIAEGMADTLLAALGEGLPDGLQDLALTDPLPELGELSGVMFSGGVAEYVYRREDRDFGDLGLRLGYALRRRIDDGRFALELLPAGECIRATALGASEYSVQLSGNTSWISSPDTLLPQRNLQVVRPDYVLGDDVDPAAVAAAIRHHLTAFDADHPASDVAIALRWSGLPAYERLFAFAQGIAEGLAQRLEASRPVYVLLDGDVAMSLGRILESELRVTSDVLVIDGLSLRDFDFIDIGRVRHPSNTVPVTIKSMVFATADADAAG
jgi:ethanolamine utilization protein EutA